MTDPVPLTDFQVEVARAFFSLPASEGFLLAGGAALAAQALTTRATQDLDFFTDQSGSVLPALEALEREASRRGWTVERQREGTSFYRITVHGPQDVAVEVDLALDSRPGMPPTMTVLGPSYAPEELAGRKVVALFDRAYPRDLADVYMLAKRFGTARLLEQAAAVDRSFDHAVLADMIRGRLANVGDDELPVPDPAALRGFYAAWAVELSQSPSTSQPAPDAPTQQPRRPRPAPQTRQTPPARPPGISL